MRDRPVRIGTHGSRGSGKTCYYAALYGKRTDGDVAITLANEETVAILESDWQALANGKRPQATAQAMPKELHYSITHQDEVSSVLACDYAGALVQRGKKDAPELKDRVFEWMKSCDALFLLVDTQHILASSPEELREQQTEMGLLLSALQKGHRIGKPLALVLTKWDLHSAPLASHNEETEKAQVFVKQHKLLGEIARGLELTGTHFRVFPVSAFGGHRDDGSLPPSEGVHPFNTLAPLAWCVERVRQIRKTRAKRIAKAIAVLVVCCMAAAVFSLNRHAQSMLDDTMRSMSDLNIPTQGVRRQVRSYRSSWNPFAHTRGRNRQLDAAYAAYQATKESADFEGMIEPMARDTKAEREQNLTAYATFLDDWPASEHRVEVEGYLSRARTIYAEEDARDALEAEVEALFRQVEAETDFGKRLEVLDAFLARKKRNAVPKNAHDQLDRVSSRRAETLAGLENAKWQSVITYCEQNADQHANCIERIDKYLAENQESPYVGAAKAKKKEVEASWDKKAYEVLRAAWLQATGSAPSVPAMKALKAQMIEYRDRAYPPPAMKEFVGTWVRWFESLENGLKASVYVESAEIVRSGPLDDLDHDPEIKVTVVAGTQSKHSKYRNPSRKISEHMATGTVVFKQSIGPLRYRLGDTLALQVRELDGAGEWAEGILDDVVKTTITPLSLDVELRKGKTRAGKVRLRFAGQTDLPAYKGGK